MPAAGIRVMPGAWIRLVPGGANTADAGDGVSGSLLQGPAPDDPVERAG